MKTYKTIVSFLFILLLGLIPLVHPHSVYAAIARVQVKHQYTAASATGYAFGSNNTLHNFIVVAVSGAGTATSMGITDTQGNTYTPLTLNNAGSPYLQLFYAADIKAGANSVKATYTGWSDVGFTAVEYSGVATTTPLDTSATNLSSSTVTKTFTSNSFNPAAGSLIFAAWADESTFTPGAAGGTGITVVQQDASHLDMQGENLSATAGSQTVAFTVANNSTGTWLVNVSAFKVGGKANGQACTLGTECTSTFCADSTCCNTACTGSTCQICDSNSNAGAGTCGYINTATDPGGECGALDCHTGGTKYYNGWDSATYGTCYYKADISAANAVCTGTSLACQTLATQCAASTQGVTTGVSATACQTVAGCTGTTAGSVPGNVTGGTDPSNGCASYSCTTKVNGWSGTSCIAAIASANDGDCNGSGACYTTFANECTGGGATLATCGSAGCKNASACVQGTATTTSDTVAEVCYTDSAQHGCSTGYACDATGTCVVPSCSSVPVSGNYTIASSCAFPGTVNGVDAGSGTTNTAVLTIGTGTPGYLTVLAGQTLAVGSIHMVNGSITIIKGSPGGIIKLADPLYLPDADGDGYPTSVTTTQYTAAAAGRARRSHTADSNEAQACADTDTNGAGVSGSALIGTSCKKCATGALANQAGSEDLFNQCAASYNACQGGVGTNGICVKTGPSGNCNGAGACDTNSGTANVADQKVCNGGSDITATASYWASAVAVCSAGSCTGTEYDRACDGNGATRSDNVGASSHTLNTNIGTTYNAICQSDTVNTCTARTTCKTSTYCNGSGACNTPANVAAGADTYNDCASYNCTTDVYGWSGNNCLVAAAGANDGDCNGSGACNTTFATECTSGATLTSCGSAGCVNAAACVQDTLTTTSDTVAEVCYTSAQHGCSAGFACNATGTCTSTATNTAAMYPTNVAATGAWTNFAVANINSAGGTYAYRASGTASLGVTNGYDFSSIPANSTINGIVVEQQFADDTAAQVATMDVRLTKDGGTTWTAYAGAQTVTGTTMTTKTYGGAANLWGTTWTTAQVQDTTNFRVTSSGNSSSASYKCNLDFVRVTIYYTP